MTALGPRAIPPVLLLLLAGCGGDTSSAPTSTVLTTIATTITLPPTTTDPAANDAALIRSLYYEQQQFVQNMTDDLDWTPDEYAAYSSYQDAHNEPTFAAVVEQNCTASLKDRLAAFTQLPTSLEATWFEKMIPDMGTLSAAPKWTTTVGGTEVTPSGRTYILQIRIENYAGQVTVQDVHATVKDDVAYWYIGGC